MVIRVAIADDHRLMRDVLGEVLTRERDLLLAGVADNGEDALSLAREHLPDVMLLDIAMPHMNGIEVARRLRTLCPDVKVLVLSSYTDKHYVQEMLKAGAKGYICKNAAATELPPAIRAVAHGKSYLSPDVAAALVGHFAPPALSAPPPMFTLATREREVLRLIADGERTPAIALRMNISPATVEVYRRNIMQKLDLHSIASLTKYAIREGLTSV